MAVFSNVHFHNHEQVVFCHDSKSGLQAIIAIHDSRRGPALGGCRMCPYNNDQDALTDVLRLSWGMTYKAAMAQLPHGGGKAVIIGNPNTDKSKELFLAMGRFVHSLGGRYITAEDSGTSVADLKVMAERTPFVTGVRQNQNCQGNISSGDPSPSTARGVFLGIQAALQHERGSQNMQGLKVAIQGIGNVGFNLAGLLHEAGAELWITDINQKSLDQAATQFNAHIVKPDEVFSLDVDIFCPCALGNAINPETLPMIKAKIIAGAANNQLSNNELGSVLQQRNILYAPDFIINAGGLIDVAFQLDERSSYDIEQHMQIINQNLLQIFQRSAETGVPTSQIAYQLAEERLSIDSTAKAV